MVVAAVSVVELELVVAAAEAAVVAAVLVVAEEIASDCVESSLQVMPPVDPCLVSGFAR